MASSVKNSDIFYYIGSIPSHADHAVPLYEVQGGTFVVTSQEAYSNLRGRQLDVIMLDEVQRLHDRPLDALRARMNLPSRVLRIDSRHKKTISYLEKNARVVIFYELYEFAETMRFKKPKTIFLTHGNMLKNYMAMYPRRMKIVGQYDFMAALGPRQKERFIKDGISEEKLIDVGVARTDNLLRLKESGEARVRLGAALGFDSNKKIISYAPTFWGATSVFDVGIKIASSVSSEYVLLVKLHPQLPRGCHDEYQRIASDRPNVFLVPSAVPAEEVLGASDAHIGDVSSILLEAILVNIPLIFAFGSGNHRQLESDYSLIQSIYLRSEYVDESNVSEVNNIINRALLEGIDSKVWKQEKNELFYEAEGGATKQIVAFISELIK